jgi:hypothetical protein
MAQSKDLQNTRFLNVDLDIYSKGELEPLIKALGGKVIVLYSGRERGRYVAHLELGRRTVTANATIRGLCSLISALPPHARKVWDSAATRDFSIGLQAGSKPFSRDFVLGANTVQAVSELAGRVVLTVYSPEVPTAGIPSA